MAFGDIYTSSFESLDGSSYSVHIQKDGYAGAVTAIKLDGANSFELAYVKHDRVCSTTVSINIINDLSDWFEFAKLNQDPYQTYKVYITKDSAFYFEGFLLPVTYNQSVSFRSLITLTFSNGLGMLKNFTPAFLTTGTEDYVTEMAILESIFSLLTWDYIIYINSTLYEDTMTSAEMADNPLRYTYENRQVYKKSDGRWDDALSILNKILKSINADCYIRDQKIYVERFVDRGTIDSSGNKNYWTWDPTASIQFSSTTEAFSIRDLDSFDLGEGSIHYQVEPATKLMKLRLAQSTYLNLMDNDFTTIQESDLLFYLFSWKNSSCLTIVNNNFVTSFMPSGVYIQNKCTFPNEYDGYLGYLTYLTNDADEVVLTFKYTFYDQAIYAWQDVHLSYQIYFQKPPSGTLYYAQEDSSGISLGTPVYTFNEKFRNDEENELNRYEVSKTLDLTGLMDALGLTGEVYVYIKVFIGYVVDNDTESTNKAPAIGAFGNFSLIQDNTKMNNLLSVAMENGAFSTTEETLDLYDADYINFKQGKLVYSSFYQLSSTWSDDLYSTKTLQQHFMLNYGNLHHSGAPILTFDLYDLSEDIKIDDIFSTSYLKDDLGADMKFYVDSFRFNARSHRYSVVLKQWIADIGKGLV